MELTGNKTPIAVTLMGTFAKQAQAIADSVKKKPVPRVSARGGRIIESEPNEVFVCVCCGCGMVLVDFIVVRDVAN